MFKVIVPFLNLCAPKVFDAFKIDRGHILYIQNNFRVPFSAKVLVDDIWIFHDNLCKCKAS